MTLKKECKDKKWKWDKTVKVTVPQVTCVARVELGLGSGLGLDSRAEVRLKTESGLNAKNDVMPQFSFHAELGLGILTLA